VLTGAPLGVRSLPVDHEPDGHAVLHLADQCFREGVSDDAGPEPKLVDVHGRRRRLDVGEHRRIEGLALDEDLDGGGAALGEGQGEPVERDRAGQQPLGVAAKRFVRDRDTGSTPAHFCATLHRVKPCGVA